MAVQVGSFHFLESWFDLRDLGMVLDHEESPAPSRMRSIAVASQDHRRSIVRRRRDERGTFRLRSSSAPISSPPVAALSGAGPWSFVFDFSRLHDGSFAHRNSL
jgi:hypothetical protein